MGSFIWPLYGIGRISSPYGWRVCPFHGKEFHSGVDIPAGSGTPIHATRPGTVSIATFSKSYGNYVQLTHSGAASKYCHMTRYVVRSGQSVQAGEVIGYVGSTGDSTGPHLHFELYVGGARVNPVSYVTVKDTAASYTGGPVSNGAGGGMPESSTASQEAAVVHIPQVEKVYTVYEDDTPYKSPDTYEVWWQNANGKVRSISDRVGGLTLTDDTDSVCTELSFQVLQAEGDEYFSPLDMDCGDFISVVNTGTQECVFTGQVQSLSGNYHESMTVNCLDNGRLLTTNDVIMQFNNVAAKTALSQLANKVGIQTISCPELISSVYSIEKANTADIARNILETVTAENGVNYFLRMMGNTLVIRSFAKDCITAWCRQAANLASFNILDEAGKPQMTRDISDLRNSVLVYSEADESVSVLAKEEDAASIQRYGKRQALETFSDQTSGGAAEKAKTVLAAKNRPTESLTLETYGSDRVVAGVRLKLDLLEGSGEYWVVAVTHNLGTPHTMQMTLRRAD